MNDRPYRSCSPEGRRTHRLREQGGRRCFRELHRCTSSALWLICCTFVHGAVAGFLLAVTPASDQDYDTTRHAAERWYRKSAEQGAAAAQVDLGISYNAGVGVPQNYVEAVAWYRRSAEQGLASAQFDIGEMYERGEGRPLGFQGLVLIDKVVPAQNSRVVEIAPVLPARR